MPSVNGKKFPYTKSGKAAAKKFKAKKSKGNDAMTKALIKGSK